jgi:hypothetical protein
MRRCLCLVAAGLILTQVVSLRPLFAADPSSGAAAASPNAAVIYWQAFAAMPTLEGEQKTKYESAIKTTIEPATDDLRPIVARFDTALRELHRARAVTACDWNLDDDAGPELLLPHLQKARDLSRAALLRARLRFAAGAADEAVADVVAVLKMARDCGVSPVLISLLVDIAMENMATEVLAANLPQLTPQQLDGLTAALKSLPTTPSLEDCIRFEGRLFGDWIERLLNTEAAKVNDPKAGGQVLEAMFQRLQVGGGSTDANDAEAAQRSELLESAAVADVRESLRLLRADYAELTKIAALPPAERRDRWAEFDAKLAASRKSTQREDALRALSHLCLPAIAKVASREDQLQVRRQLLLLAIQVQRHGPDAVRTATVPGHGPVEYHKTDADFELRCQPASADKPDVFQVGIPLSAMRAQERGP